MRCHALQINQDTDLPPAGFPIMTITRRRRIWIAAILLAVFSVTIPPCLSAEGSVHIAVASNFAPTLRSLMTSFRLQSPYGFKISTASTGKLFAQIRHGAPFDIFLSADAERPKRLIAKGDAIAESLFTYAIGRLALWQPAGAQIAKDSEILGVTITRLAVANPKTAPYGKAAEETLRALGLWQTWRARLVRGENIGQTYQFVASGAVDAGLVALSQILARNKPVSASRQDWSGLGPGARADSPRNIFPIHPFPVDRGSTKDNQGQPKSQIRIVPSSLHAPLRQQAVLLRRGADNAGARGFMEFLRSREAREIIRAEGYGLPDELPGS
uniref:Molybdenum ABC transporter, molybdate-binding protein n=1 Tax=Candidatus Kentrum sp. UNK TaxID=2126344 RepID=A0A451A9M2_9GAMM|nr:MAG: molybdenum ABC transporter, molybdate-binding protein [Candidatus Kentron sp. UNK]VFK70584.1 MAG: molybdenum ABC transporter, molybdate-binding protein [Candidatus Kentron sp. UNK]